MDVPFRGMKTEKKDSMMRHSRGGGNPVLVMALLMQHSYVYILASQKNGTLYVGVTSDLAKRIYEHKNDLIDGFSKKYNVHNLVYYEVHSEIEEAISREKQIKKWNREW